MKHVFDAAESQGGHTCKFTLEPLTPDFQQIPQVNTLHIGKCNDSIFLCLNVSFHLVIVMHEQWGERGTGEAGNIYY